MTRFALPSLLSLLVPLATGCFAATVQRSALTPAVVRPIRTTPVEGLVEVGGSMSVSELDTHAAPENGDAGLYASTTDAQLHARFRVAPGFAIGTHFDLGFYGGSTATYDGVPSPRASVVFGAGPELSYATRFEGTPVGIGVGASLTVASIPWAEYYYETTTGAYAYSDHGSDVVPLFHVAFALHFYATDATIVEVGGALQNHARNAAFGVEMPDSSGNLSADAYGGVPYIGLSYRDESGFLVRGQVLFPIGFGPLDVVPVGGALTLGAELGS